MHYIPFTEYASVFFYPTSPGQTKRRFAPMLPKVGVFTTHKLQPHNLEASHANHEKNNGVQWHSMCNSRRFCGRKSPTQNCSAHRWLECSQTSTCGTMWLRFTLIRSVPRVWIETFASLWTFLGHLWTISHLFWVHCCNTRPFPNQPTNLQ